jgi:hypothetical protein
MEIALAEVAKTDRDKFVDLSSRLSRSEFETAQYLLVRAYTAAGAALADLAADCLIADPRSLQTGYMSDSHWAARQLIEAISPHCDDLRLRRLEEVILNYYFPMGADRLWADESWARAVHSTWRGNTCTSQRESASAVSRAREEIRIAKRDTAKGCGDALRRLADSRSGRPKDDTMNNGSAR